MSTLTAARRAATAAAAALIGAAGLITAGTAAGADPLPEPWQPVGTAVYDGLTAVGGQVYRLDRVDTIPGMLPPIDRSVVLGPADRDAIDTDDSYYVYFGNPLPSALAGAESRPGSNTPSGLITRVDPVTGANQGPVIPLTMVLPISEPMGLLPAIGISAPYLG